MATNVYEHDFNQEDFVDILDRVLSNDNPTHEDLSRVLRHGLNHQVFIANCGKKEIEEALLILEKTGKLTISEPYALASSRASMIAFEIDRRKKIRSLKAQIEETTRTVRND